ncbi:MAG TPA: hypothetical protein DDY61_05720 [Ruminococcaceae bacterium]|nr:hypothetical protein [Oscillospiraceae bacterium]
MYCLNKNNCSFFIYYITVRLFLSIRIILKYVRKIKFLFFLTKNRRMCNKSLKFVKIYSNIYNITIQSTLVSILILYFLIFENNAKKSKMCKK